MFLPGTEIVADANVVEEMGGQASHIKEMQAVIGAPQTGLFDEATFNALKTFQQNSGLQVTGYPNDETINALQAVAAGSFSKLTWWDWAIIYAFEYKWVILGVGIAAVGGLGYWLWTKKKRRS